MVTVLPAAHVASKSPARKCHGFSLHFMAGHSFSVPTSEDDISELKCFWLVLSDPVSTMGKMGHEIIPQAIFEGVPEDCTTCFR